MANARRTRLVEFKTGRISIKVRKATTKALDTVARKMTKTVRTKISKPYPPASTPGNHPHSRRANGLKSTFIVVRTGRNLVARVPQYGIWVDGGTSKMRPRPFIRRNLHDRKAHWMKMLRSEIKKQSLRLSR